MSARVPTKRIHPKWVELSREVWNGPTLDLMMLAEVLRAAHLRGAEMALREAWPGDDVREGMSFADLASAVCESAAGE